MNTTSRQSTFTVGQILKGRSIGESNCVFTGKVVSRTAKQVTITLDGSFDGQPRKFGIKNFAGVEYINPFGTYSMALSIYADCNPNMTASKN